MNFMMNAASVPLLLVILIAYQLVWIVIGFVAVKLYRISCCRRLGMRASGMPTLGFTMLKVIFEAYVELVMSSTMSVIALFETVDGAFPAIWFTNFDDSLNSILALITLAICLVLPAFFFYLTRWRKEVLS